jgi:glycosyltransferase involved in cell wall biosynthesis
MTNEISIAIPTYCRAKMLHESFDRVIGDARIREVVVSDDFSQDGSFESNLSAFKNLPQVKIYRNKENVDCYANKRQAMEHVTSEWSILFDDDNILEPDYIDRIFNLGLWDPNTLYCPDWARPHFNYTTFAGQLITRRNVARFMTMNHFRTALNTCNYFVNRQSFLEVWDGSVNPHTADSLFQAYNWLKAGKRIMIVPGLRYFHRVHEGSHYKRNLKKTGTFAHEIEQKLRMMK